VGVWTRSTIVGAALLLVILTVSTRDSDVVDTVGAPSAPTLTASPTSATDGAAIGGWEMSVRGAGPAQQAEGTATSVGTPSVTDGTDTYEVLEAERGSGRLITIPGASATVGWGELHTFTIEVEDHLAPYAENFAEDVERTLFDPRGWTAHGEYALRRVDEGEEADLRVSLASPSTVDDLCAPLETTGRFSCWNGERAVINVWRWNHGAHAYVDDLDGYRTYLVNHEVGHALGHDHVDCPAPGEPAPVMMQQTIGVGDCRPSPWPYPDGD
jgi:hypothetical protein